VETKAVTQAESDDEDFDELDDLLDEFQIQEPQSSSPKPPLKGSNAGLEKSDSSFSGDDDFAAQLQHGMTDLLREMNDSKELQDQFEKLVKELSDTTAGTDAPARSAPASGPSSESPAPTEANNFQDRIKQAMDRMKSSEAEMEAASAEPESDDFLAEMLKQMQSTSGHGGSEEEFSTMLVNMMEQLTSKDILYEPMKELYDKYPAWLRDNEGKQPVEDMTRYREQYDTVKKIVKKFQEPGYKDEDDSCRTYIVEQMQKMQSAGSPPQELMGDVGQGVPDLPPDADPENCGVQ